MKKRFLSILLIIFIFANTTFTCYATEVVSSFLTWASVMEKIKSLKDMSKEEILMDLLTNLRITSGSIAHSSAFDKEFINYWINEFVGEQEKNVGDMTENELDALLETYYGKMNSKNSGVNKDGKFVFSDELIKEFRSCLDTYMKDNTTPLYYMTHVGNINDIKASNCITTYVYNTIKALTEKYGIISIQISGSVEPYIYVVDLSSLNDYICIGNVGKFSNFTDINSAQTQLFDKSTEKLITFPFYKIEFGDDYQTVESFDDYRVTSYQPNIQKFFVNSVDIYNDSYNSWNFYKLGYSYAYTYHNIVANEDTYVKIYSSLANYQDYITNTSSQNVYYTSNYFKTENIQQSPIGLDEMVKLYEAYDDLCKKIIQYVQDTQNATDTMIVNKLDELIKAVYATGGTGGSADVDVNVDMTETNNILTKILEAIKNIRSDTYIDYGDSTVNTDWANIITNMVVQPEININTTIGNMSDAFKNSTSMLKKKFPFSIPWDIAFLLEFLADTPTTPKFGIPFTIESMDVHETVVIDLENFEAVSKVSRMLLTILYMVALMQLTTKMVIVGKEQ